MKVIGGNSRKSNRGYAESWTSEQLDKLLSEDWLRQMVAEIRGGDEKKKDKLPYICPHYSEFKNNHRAQADIIPEAFTFMTCVDVDDKRLVKRAIKRALELNEDEYSDWQDMVLRIAYSARKKVHIYIRIPKGMTIEEAQQTFCKELGIPYDESCITPERFIYVTGKDEEVFRSPHWLEPLSEEEIAERREAYLNRGLDVDGRPLKNVKIEKLENENHTPQSLRDSSPNLGEQQGTYEKFGVKWFVVEQSQALFEEKNNVYGDEELQYKGKDLRQIALAWFAQRGGVPEEGDRNQGLFELACDLRYIVDFNAEKMLACMPAILDKSEVKAAIKSALGRERLTTQPNRLKNVLKGLTAEQKEEKEEETEQKTNIYDLLQKSTYILPANQLPPIFREFVAIAPEDFKKASVVALLPMLGTLGSRLRATYLDGVVQTPSFQCEIEAPMASGKSFANRVDEVVMGEVRKQDTIYRKKEQAYQKKVKAAINKKEQPEVETYPIRIINPTTSVAALLERQMNVGDVHLYSFTDEIKVVLDSMKRGSYGDLRALMRNAFDNQYFGQDYKGDKSTNTMCRIYFNTLHCGTPAEYRKFYDNSEDGTISRILFAELPDQSFKEMPKFKVLTDKQKESIVKGVQRLTEVTIKDDQIQPECELQDFGFVNEWAASWLTKMRLLAKEENNRSLDTFRRRAAVVGFRAAMIAWFLYDKNTKQNKAKTVAFAEMIAEQMLVSLLHRFKVSEVSNVIYYKNVWNMLKEQFTSSEVDQSAEAVGVKTPAKHIISRWKEQNLVEKLDKNLFKKKII